jgi:hypothetical protein
MQSPIAAGNSRANGTIKSITVLKTLKMAKRTDLLSGRMPQTLFQKFILTSIDNQLYHKEWRYTRNIDDYAAYVRTYEDGQQFLIDLAEELRNFDLSLNHKKTKIMKLPPLLSNGCVGLTIISFPYVGGMEKLISLGPEPFGFCN